jgi:hypothetical protein
MNKRFLFIALFFSSFAAFAEKSPMNGWEFTNMFVTLNGQFFSARQYPQSWREQDGYAIVQGRTLHYWLYDTISYHGGDGSVIYNRVIPEWVEEMGYVIDYDGIKVYDPNPELASSVRALMQQRGCDISVTLVTDYPRYDYFVINEYFKSKGKYKTTVYPLYRRFQ